MNQTTLVLTIVGTGIGATAVIVSVVAVVASGINGRLNPMSARLNAMSARLDAMNGQLNGTIESLRGDMRADHQALDGLLRAVEITLGKVEQRLDTAEHARLPQAPPAV